MSEDHLNNGHIRKRAQSLFEHRPRINTELTLDLLEKLVSLNVPSLPSHGSVISAIPTDHNDQYKKKRRRILYIGEPLVAGLLIFPLIAIFWQSAWNFFIEWFDSPSGQHPSVLPGLYVVAQLILLFIYLNQNRLYDFLQQHEDQFWFVNILLQFHSFLTGIAYVAQWVSLWTIWDVYTSNDWLLMFVSSLAAILAIIALTGHPCDIVCAPFIISYDSIEFNVRIGTPFIIEKIGDGYANLLNYFLYEHVILIFSIIAWRGLYQFLDIHLFPDYIDLSAGVSLIIGYSMFFVLMYTQSCQVKQCLATQFMELNYSSFIPNLRHLMAFFSCVFLWRGFWIFYDNYLATLPFTYAHPYVFYTICTLASFLILTLLRTASSVNGPMSHMHDEYSLFPFYPNCYLVQWLDKREKEKGKQSSSSSPSSSSSKDLIPGPFSIAVF